MENEVTVVVSDIVGSPYAVAVDDGQKVYEKITPFLRVAVGQLYKEFEEDTIRELLSVADIKETDLALLNWAVENTRSYFKNPKAFDQAWKEVMGHDE